MIDVIGGRAAGDEVANAYYAGLAQEENLHLLDTALATVAEATANKKKVDTRPAIWQQMVCTP